LQFYKGTRLNQQQVNTQGKLVKSLGLQFITTILARNRQSVRLYK